MTTFLPWVRSGVAARLPVADEPGAALTNAAEVDVTLDVTGVAPAPVKLRPYGPGDVTALDAARIVRCEPPDGTTTFDPDHFPAVELDEPDLPWLFTPAAPAATGRLRPWLVLVVVADRPGVVVEPHESGRLPVLRIASPARPAEELPPLDESWAWAHAQVLDDAVDDALAHRPLATLSRLVAPRRLEPYRRYIACLVPAFEAGRQAGLGVPADGPDAALAPAWTRDAATVELPVYHHWTFATGRGGDFRALARKLRPGRLAAGAGTRPLSVPSLAGGADMEVLLEGALTETGHERAPLPDPGWPDALRALLEADEDVVAPPRYGAWYVDEPGDGPATRAAGLPREGEEPPWLREVNLDPRERAAAGLGARVVERIREQLVAEAWAQAAHVVQARRLHERARLSGAVGERVVERHLEPLDVHALLQVTAPAHAQLATPSDTAGRTIGTLLDDRGYPTDVTNPALRRLVRPDGPVGDLLPHTPQQARLGASLARAVGAVSQGIGVVTRPPALATLAAHGLEDATADAVNAATPPAGWTPSDPAAPSAEGGDAAVVERFRKAAARHLDHLEATAESTAADDAAAPWTGDADVRQRLLDGLDPHTAGRRRLDSRVPVGEGLPVARPVIGRAMYTALNDITARLLLPGAASLEPETVCAAVTNPRFIEAFMLGLNHEANRLLLWRGVPIDRRAMPFQRFWRSAGTGEPPELPAVDDWPAGSSLGEHLLHTPHGRAGAGGVVLVIRGELFRRHPGATVYARRAVWSDGVRTLADGGDDPADNAYPRVHGRIGDDAALVGLFVDADGTALDEAAVRGADDDAGDAGWFFLLQEHPAEPRFGLAPPPDGDAPRRATWADVSWADLPDAAPYVPVNGGAPDTSWVADPGGASWGATAADMAVITLRRPYRAAVHARALVAARAEAEA